MIVQLNSISSLLKGLYFLLTASIAMSAFSPKVAIVGGGISGLSCARRFQALGIESTVFDTGKQVVGGRCSSRILQADGKKHITDHASQFFTASSDALKDDLKSLQSDGSIIEWNGKLIQIATPQTRRTIDYNIEKPRYVCKEGMGSFSRKLAQNLDVKRPVWVSKMERCKQNPEKWKLYHYNEFLGYFDVVVIAHNGKCADKLMSTADVPRIHNLLKVNFGDTLPPLNRMRKMQLCSLWVSVFAVKGALPIDFEGAYVSHGKTLSWICNNTKKMKPIATPTNVTPQAEFNKNSNEEFPSFGASKAAVAPKAAFSYAAAASKSTPSSVSNAKVQSNSAASSGSVNSGNNDVECWTLTSTREFGAANKVPQENVPPEKEREISSLMLRAMEDATGLPSGSIVPISQKVQLWGAAVPMNRHTAPFVMDGAAGVGVCGDWFTPSSSSTGPSIESAYLSGRFLADAVAERFHSKVIKDHGLELHHSFEACAGHPLGDVPTGANTPSQTGSKRGPALGDNLNGAPSSGQNACQPNSGNIKKFFPPSGPSRSTPSTGQKPLVSKEGAGYVSSNNGKRVYVPKSVSQQSTVAK